MRVNVRAWPAVMLAAMAVATWPVWRWYALRITDGSDEPWGVLALVTVAALASRNGGALPCEERRFVWPAALLAVYVATFAFVPPLVRAIVAASAFGALLLRGRGAAGLWGLLALSLPVVPTLQFYLGYPLRLLAAEASAISLRGCGYLVVREGSLLHWAGESVMVDAPCSGIQMLWCGFYLAFGLAAYHRLTFPATVLCAGATLLIVVLANMARATLLFFKEAHIVAAPEWTHAGAGLVMFATAAWLIAALTHKLQHPPCIA